MPNHPISRNLTPISPKHGIIQEHNPEVRTVHKVMNIKSKVVLGKELTGMWHLQSMFNEE